MTLPRRIQLVKLLRANGLRDVERMREEELKAALGRLRLVIPDRRAITRQAPSSHAFLARPALPPPPFDDGDDPHALPRFREPKLLLPDGERTFLRAIAVKPRLLFCTWDLAGRERERAGARAAQLWLYWRDFLGDAPAADLLLAQHPAVKVDVELGAGGWYVTVPGERLAVAAALVVDGERLATSNVSLTPPARPAPPGPLWVATLPPSFDRRRLRGRGLLRGEIPEAALTRKGETDARGLDIDDDLPTSGATMRLPWLHAELPSSSTGALDVTPVDRSKR